MAFRSRGIGQALIYAAEVYCRERGIEYVEVGLPGEGFSEFSRTAGFYEKAGFEPIRPP